MNDALVKIGNSRTKIKKTQKYCSETQYRHVSRFSQCFHSDRLEKAT